MAGNLYRVKTWGDETLYPADLNAEFDNIISGLNGGGVNAELIDQTDDYTWSGANTFTGTFALKTTDNAAASVKTLGTLEWDPGDGANLTDNSSGIGLDFKLPDSADNQDIFASLNVLCVDDTSTSEDGEFSFKVMTAGTNTEQMTLSALALTVTPAITATGGITSGGNIVSDTDSTDDLGSASVAWANLYVDDITCTNDLLMASGGIINFNSGDITLTHSSNDLKFNGGTFSYAYSGTTIFQLDNDSIQMGQSANGIINSQNSFVVAIDSNNSGSGTVFDIYHNGEGQTGTRLFRVDDSGNVNVPGLTASQDVQTDGSKNLVSVSDKTWKIDRGGIDNPLAIMRGFEGRYFTWRRDAANNDLSEVEQPRLAGFYSQDVYAAFPEGSPGGANTDADGVDHWGLNARAILALHHEALKAIMDKLNL